MGKKKIWHCTLVVAVCVFLPTCVAFTCLFDDAKQSKQSTPSICEHAHQRYLPQSRSRLLLSSSSWNGREPSSATLPDQAAAAAAAASGQIPYSTSGDHHGEPAGSPASPLTGNHDSNHDRIHDNNGDNGDHLMSTNSDRDSRGGAGDMYMNGDDDIDDDIDYDSNNDSYSDGDSGNDIDNDIDNLCLCEGTGTALKAATHIVLDQSTLGQWESKDFNDAANTLDAWSYKWSRNAPIISEHILRRIILEQLAQNQTTPELHQQMRSVYHSVVRVWANSRLRGAPERAEEIMDAMQEQYERFNDTNLQPTIETFNYVLRAYSKSRQRDAVEQIVRVILKMEHLRALNKTDAIPNDATYFHWLLAISHSGNQKALAQMKHVLTRLQQLHDSGHHEIPKPSRRCHSLYIDAICTAVAERRMQSSKGAQMADDHLRLMIARDDDEAKPETHTLNVVIDAWSKTWDSRAAQHAESLVRLFENYHIDCGKSFSTMPNTHTYNGLIACYSRSGAPGMADKSYRILQRMENASRSVSNSTLQPNEFTYGTVMNAYAKSNQKNAPVLVEELLCVLIQKHNQTGDHRLRPTIISFNICIGTWAKSNDPRAIQRISQWINYMERLGNEGHRLLYPNTRTYNRYIQALAKTNKPDITDRSIAVLNLMIQRCKDPERYDLAPNAITFTNIIRCLSASDRHDALDKAKDLLSLMEDLHSSGFRHIRPNVVTYNSLIEIAAKSKKPNKARIAASIVRQMRKVSLRPNTITFNLALNACANSNPDDDPKQVLDVAMHIFQEARSTSATDFVTYSTTVRVISEFGSQWQHQQMLQDMFEACCEDGQIRVSFLTQLKLVLDDSAQYRKMERRVVDSNGKILKAVSNRVVLRQSRRNHRGDGSGGDDDSKSFAF